MNIELKSTALAAVSILAVICSAAPAAMAQSAQKAPKNSAESAPVKLDQQKLKSFAVAYLQVDRIKRQYQPKLQKATSAAEQQKIKTEASQKMVAAVNGVDGMTVQEYSSILASAQSDPKLAKQLTEEIKQTANSRQ